MSTLRILRYNLLMRVLAVMLVLLVLPYIGWAADCSCAAEAQSCPDDQVAQPAMDDCCHLITSVCLEVKYQPRCNWPDHKCPEPLVPCDRCLVPDKSCHKPLECYVPCDSICQEEVCHRPAVVVFPGDPCPAASVPGDG